MVPESNGEINLAISVKAGSTTAIYPGKLFSYFAPTIDEVIGTLGSTSGGNILSIKGNYFGKSNKAINY